MASEGQYISVNLLSFYFISSYFEKTRQWPTYDPNTIYCNSAM